MALPVALLLLSLVLLLFGLRSDAASVGLWPLWGPAGVMVGAAYVVLMLALVQRAPESTVHWVWWMALPVAAIALQIGGAYWTLKYTGTPANVSVQAQTMCFWRISLLAVPPVLVALWRSWDGE